MRGEALGVTQQKVLILLRAGVALSLLRATRVTVQVQHMRELRKEWQALNRSALTRTVASLYHSKLVKKQEHADGTVTLVLTDEGKRRSLRYDLRRLMIPKPPRWDGKWRIVMYDVPEDLRDVRLELLRTLKRLGFFELQQSVFVHPYECRDEIEYVIEAYDARKYVRRMVVDEVDIAAPLLKHFKLSVKK